MWNPFKKDKIIPHNTPEPAASRQDDLVEYKVGDRIGGDYLVKEIFGGAKKSGMGIVYLVEHRSHDKPLVLKSFQITKDRKDLSDQFKREAKAWVAAGVHPNTVKAISVEEIDFRLFVAAEYIEKDEDNRNNVREYISCGAMNPYWILNWAAQFCYAMRYALNNGLKAHLDIKPENLMIDKELHLKVTDFGLAVLSGGDVIPHAGTLPYMGPEQLAKNTMVDHRCDIYALGIVMYEMFTGGGYPYDIAKKGNDIQIEFMKAHIDQAPRKLNTPIGRIIDRCLRKQPGQRYQNYDQLLADLNIVAQEMGFKIPSERMRSADDVSEELFLQAQSEGRLGNKEKALALIDQYIQKFPEESPAWTEKGRILLEMGRIRKAEEAFKRSLELFPYSSAVWNNLGLLYSRSKRFDSAIGAFSRALEFDAGNSGALMNLASTYFKAGRYSETVTTFICALTKYPDKETLVVNADITVTELMRINHTSQAIEILDKLTKIKPQVTNYWHNLALCKWQTKKIREAEICFKKVLDLNPADEFAWLTLAKLASEAGRIDEAFGYCDKAISLPKGEVKGAALKAQLLDHKNQYSEATRCIKSALKNHPDEDSLYFVWASMAIKNGRKSEALDSAKRCRQILVSKYERPNQDNLEMIDVIIRQAASDG